MTEPMIEETEAEDFTDELSDEALDREGVRACSGTGACVVRCRAGN